MSNAGINNGPTGLRVEMAGTANVAAPVPEPETYALILCGLGFVAFRVRRRKGAEEAAGFRSAA